ncbi:regulator of G-protein signaling 11 [Clupea harengus]|uniref:Regulator of G-protein signaling 11 n=1 Tax=Clupea harengus TaxID=7950 RepID=A0A6P8F3B6_CLUHA|nr:regulator of G-protein signaling 11 [Clupea harengus]
MLQEQDSVIVRNMKSEVSRVPDLERELKRLREENAFLRETRENSSLLKEEVEGLRKKVERLEQAREDLLNMELQREKLVANLQAWENLGQNTGLNIRKPEDLSREVIDIQQREINFKQQNYTLTSSSGQNSDFYKKEIEQNRRCLGRNRVKSSICLESYIKHSEQYQDHDPIMQGCLPSNPWITDDSQYWSMNSDMVAMPTRLRVERWGFSFMELLNDPMGLRELMTYLEKEFSAENLCFWQACEDVRHGETSKINSKVDEVYKQFLAPGASRWVNIDSKTMEKTLIGIKRAHRFVLDDAQLHIYFLMKKDSYPRYLKSDLYKNLLAKAIVPQETKKSVFPFMRRQRHSSPSPAMVSHAGDDDGKEKAPGVQQQSQA